eukprot:TRINITY_DN43933_c0_g1_i1.p1 TRINITY_DN43933_c0_g1~~TRINITY_DN43933_c0_g1_i1.p1  ORF type:complete len:405 (+),score=47.54 TRINITY_DN43933_c0_g1_i1:84-1298(+)
MSGDQIAEAAAAIFMHAIFLLARFLLWLLPLSERPIQQPIRSHGSPPAGVKTLLVHGMLVKCNDLAPAEDVICASISTTASSHDKACELWAYLNGTQVDYGEEHSKEHGHPRFGTQYTAPAYPGWGEGRPLHIAGHSAGGITALLFAHMVATGQFKIGGRRSNAGWVGSVSCIQSPLGGTPAAGAFQAVYHEQGTVLPAWSVASAISAFVQLYDKLAPRLLRRVFCVASPYSGSVSLRECFLTDSWMSTTDCCLWELSEHASKQMLDPIELHPSIAYFSVCTDSTTHTGGHLRAVHGIFPLLRYTCGYLAGLGLSSDGLVPVEAQRAPKSHIWGKYEFGGQVKAGQWNVLHLKADHFSLYAPDAAGCSKLVVLAQGFKNVAARIQLSTSMSTSSNNNICSSTSS